MRLLPLLALLIAFPAHGQVLEKRAVISLTTTDTNLAFGYSIQNTSTAASPITSVRLTLNSGTVFDTFGAPSSNPYTISPTIGANNDSQSATSVLLTFNTPLMPGQTSAATGGGDIDGAALTSITAEVLFAGDATPTILPLVQMGSTWSLSLALPSVQLYPVELTWDPPTQNTDGSPYIDAAGFNIYWGSVQGTYANSKPILNPTAEMDTVLVPRGEWYFVATAVNTSGRESDYSNVARGTAGPSPRAPLPLGASVPVESSGTAYTVFTIRNQIIAVEVGTARSGAACDDLAVRAMAPDGTSMLELNLVAVEDVNLLPSVFDSGELAVFAECGQ